MQAQNFKNHSRMIPLYHYLLYFIIIACFVVSIWNMYRAYKFSSGRLVAAVLVGLCIAAALLTWYTRAFALIDQDRAIRSEENLRHFVLTGRLPDPRLSIRQLIALRFAEDTEFLILSEKAAKESLKPNEIKKSILNWRVDNHRV